MMRIYRMITTIVLALVIGISTPSVADASVHGELQAIAQEEEEPPK